VRIVAVQDDGHFDIEGDDLKITLWHHDVDTLRSALRQGAQAAWRPRFHVLSAGSASLLNVGTADRVTP
jgi:hypothetical protein